MSMKDLIKEYEKLCFLESYIYTIEDFTDLNNVETLFEVLTILDYNLFGTFDIPSLDNEKRDLYVYEVKLLEQDVLFILFDEFEKTFEFNEGLIYHTKKNYKVSKISYCSLLYIKQNNIPIYYVIHSSSKVFHKPNPEIHYCAFCGAKFNLVCKNCNINYIELLLKDIIEKRLIR